MKEIRFHASMDNGSAYYTEEKTIFLDYDDVEKMGLFVTDKVYPCDVIIKLYNQFVRGQAKYHAVRSISISFDDIDWEYDNGNLEYDEDDNMIFHEGYEYLGFYIDDKDIQYAFLSDYE